MGLLSIDRDPRRIHMPFVEMASARTQEFVLRWSRGRTPHEEVLRQTMEFPPQRRGPPNRRLSSGLAGATMLELTVKSDIPGSAAYALLNRLRLALPHPFT